MMMKLRNVKNVQVNVLLVLIVLITVQDVQIPPELISRNVHVKKVILKMKEISVKNVNILVLIVQH